MRRLPHAVPARYLVTDVNKFFDINSQHTFLELLKEKPLAKITVKEICELSSKAPVDVNPSLSVLHFSYIAGGIAGTIEYWLRSGMEESPEVIAEYLQRFTLSVTE